MMRLSIGVDGITNNIGQPTVCAVKGRIKFVQFALFMEPGSGQNEVELSFAPVMSVPIANSSQVPSQIAYSTFEKIDVTTATQAQAAIDYSSQLIPCDSPVDIGVQLFVNANNVSGSDGLVGSVIVFIDV